MKDRTPQHAAADTMGSVTVGVIVGSLRRESLTRKLACAMIDLAPAGLAFSDIAIGDLVHYNPDLDGAAAPTPWQRLRAGVRAADALLFVTPEYNRAVPAVVKNALDVGSRPYGEGVWQGKPALVVSGSPGSLGGVAAHHSLRQMLAPLGVAVLPTPEVAVSKLGDLFDAEGRLTRPETARFLAGAMADFARWIARLTAVPA